MAYVLTKYSRTRKNAQNANSHKNTQLQDIYFRYKFQAHGYKWLYTIDKLFRYFVTHTEPTLLREILQLKEISNIF